MKNMKRKEQLNAFKEVFKPKIAFHLVEMLINVLNAMIIIYFTIIIKNALN